MKDEIIYPDDFPYFPDPEDNQNAVDETIRYTIDSYGQLEKKVTQKLTGLSQKEVEAYAKTAKAAGDAATFKVMMDGTVEASIEHTTKVIETEAGKWAEAQQKAEEAGQRNVISSSRAANGEFTRSVNNSNTVLKNGVKTTTDTVTSYIQNLYGQIIGQTKELVKTVDDGINQTVIKIASASSNQQNKTIQTAKMANGDLKTTVTETQNVVKNGITSIVETVTENITNMYGKLISQTKNVSNSIDDGINKRINTSESANTNNAYQTVENTVDAFGQIKQIVTDTSETVSNGVTKINNVTTTNIIDQNGKLVSSVKNVTQTIKDAAKTITNNYTEGLKQAIPVIKSFKDAFGNTINIEYEEAGPTKAGQRIPVVPSARMAGSPAPSSVTNYSNPVSVASANVDKAAVSAASSINSMNNVSFSKLISNLNSVARAFNNLNSQAQKFTAFMNSTQKSGSKSGGTQNVYNNSRVGQINNYGEKKSTERTRRKMVGV
jgi:hypothetical protein